ncbi:MAG: amidohydrolase family protein, partial [Myxococcota bacterium]|nr:amidohydrolase family protein [Myxococcota bacterium]
MKKLLYKAAYSNGQWIENALFTLSHDGTIQSISSLPSFQYQGADVFSGLAVPSFVNSHSHAFQYAMIGETENLPVGAKGDNFWSWRERMYDLALQTSPDSLYTIALRLYRSLLQCGFGTVVEFHYLHHAPDGTPYRNPAAMGESLIQAAKDSGIDICLVP